MQDKLTIKLNSLQEFFNHKKTLIQVVEQLNKDLLIVSKKVLKKDIKSFQNLFDKLYDIVWDLEDKRSGQLSNLLYRVDVGEHKIKREIETTLNPDIKSIITKMILEREFQKVIIRNHYSEQLNT